MLKYREVGQSDYRFLYRLLKERDQTINISHSKMPTYAEHVQFCQSSPYFVWILVILGRKRVGHYYITRDGEIGLFIAKAYQGRGIGYKVLGEAQGMAYTMIADGSIKRIIANINPKNKRSIALFKSVGFKHIQNTYRLE